MSQPVIILGTGRCGSTLLSKIFNDHPDVLSLSEYNTALADFGGTIAEFLAEGDMTGQEYWEKISAALPRVNLLASTGIDTPEMEYGHASGNTEFKKETGIPNILFFTLSMISDDPDALFHELEAVVPNQPTGNLRHHNDLMFGFLMQKFGNKLWVERSGGAMVYFGETLKHYPDAKWVHIVRDGRNVAPSMQAHPGFRIFMIFAQLTETLGYDPYKTDDRTGVEKLPPELAAFLPENFDRDIFLGATPPLEAMGGLWSQMITEGSAALAQFPAENVLTISYERLCAKPTQVLEQLMDFVGASKDADWIAKTAAGIKMSPTDWRKLPDDERAALEAACAPGLEVVSKFL